MDIPKLLATLLPTVEKQTLLEDLRLTRGEIHEVTKPVYASAMPFLKSWKFKSQEIQDLFITFKRIVRSQGNDNPYVTIEKSFDNILKNIEDVESMVEKVYSEEVAGGGLTYLKANLLQFAQAATFYSKFARKFLLYTYIYETSQYEEGGTSVGQSLSQAERDYVVQNFSYFCLVHNAISGNPGSVKKALDDIPDIVATTDNAGMLNKTMGEEKLDPFRLKFIPIVLNPIYHVRMAIAEWQASRYKQARDELSLLQLRKINLEQTADGKPDARTQAKINSLEERIADTAAKIRKMEAAHE